MENSTDIDLATRVTVPEHVLVREIDGESVLLDLDGERYFGLDPTGTEMWKALAAGEPLGTAVHELLTRYEVDSGALERDLIGLAAKLVGHGLLEIRA